MLSPNLAEFNLFLRSNAGSIIEKIKRQLFEFQSMLKTELKSVRVSVSVFDIAVIAKKANGACWVKNKDSEENRQCSNINITRKFLNEGM